VRQVLYQRFNINQYSLLVLTGVTLQVPHQDHTYQSSQIITTMKKKNTNRIFSVFILGVLFILLNSCSDFEKQEPAPVPNDDTDDFVAIAAGYNHTLALVESQYIIGTSLLAWGNNLYGQLGDSTNVNKDKPIYIGSGYSRIAAGGSHSLALKSDTLFAWGDNHLGQLGNATYFDKSSPVQIGTGYAQISAGFSHSLALKQDGTLWAWGDNMYGQLGDGTNENKNAPMQVGSGYSSIAAGGRHSLALKTDGSLWAWGDNMNGQLGDGTNESKNIPVQIGSGYSGIAAGGRHSLALKTDGFLWVWGSNEFGQLGDGTNIDKNTPLLDANLWNDVDDIAAGESHTLALKQDGRLLACGRNDVGQSGGISYVDMNTFTLIGSLYVGIAAGGAQSFGLKEEELHILGWPYYINHLWAWGDNQYGQLGCGPLPKFTNTARSIGRN
jgi:alpha-tubulin suppressor-like RCC1 family protein